MAANWRDPMLAGTVYHAGLLVQNQLKRAQQAVDAKQPKQAVSRLRFTLSYIASISHSIPYQAIMRDIKETRLAVHDHDPLLTAAYLRTLRRDIEQIALAMPDQPETPAKTLGFLDRAEHALHFSVENNASWKKLINEETADWQTAGAALKDLQAFIDEHTVYVPLDFIANQIETAISALQGAQPDYPLARASVGEGLTATIGGWVDDKAMQTQWGVEHETADPLDPQRAATPPAPHWGSKAQSGK
jgi:hypothetical protein